MNLKFTPSVGLTPSLTPITSLLRPVKAKMPLIPGHEGAGVVAAVGSEVTNLKVGDRVGVAWLHSACGHCEYCIQGWETLCVNQQNSGYSVDGCLGEYAIAAASHAVKIPEKVSFEQAARKFKSDLYPLIDTCSVLLIRWLCYIAILCAGVTSYKGIKEADVRPGQFLGIVGAAGGLGHLAVQYAKAMGLRPIAYDVGQGKSAYCKSIGAEYYIDATSPNAVKDTMDYTEGGVHGALVIATSPPAFALGTDICRRKGTVVCCGLPPGSFPTPIFDVVLKRVTIRGSIVGTREDLHEALDFAARGEVKCTVQTRKLEDVNDIFEKLKNGQIEGRTVITFDN